MNKEDLIAKYVASVSAYNQAIDETTKIKVEINNAEFVLADKVASIYLEKDAKELGSNSEIRNANIALLTESEKALVRNLSNNLEFAKAKEIKARNEVDQIKYIIRALNIEN